MDLRILSRRAIGAVAGAAMLAASSASSPAFTLSAPSLERPVAAADVESVYWRHWGGWHGGWHRGWGWHGGWHRWGWGRGGVRAIMATDRAGIAGGPRGASAAAAGSEASELGVSARPSVLLLGRIEAGRADRKSLVRRAGGDGRRHDPPIKIALETERATVETDFILTKSEVGAMVFLLAESSPRLVADQARR